MDFPLPIFSVCALFLVPAPPYQLRLGHISILFPPPPIAYLVCDTLHSFDCEHFEHFYVDIIICSFLNLSYHVMGLSVVSFCLASFWYFFSLLSLMTLEGRV